MLTEPSNSKNSVIISHGAFYPQLPRIEPIQNGPKTIMSSHQRRPGASFAATLEAVDIECRPPEAESIFQTHKETMNGIWRSPAPKP